MSLRGFATLNFWADDVPAAAAWYAEFLGVEPYFSRPGPDGRPAYVEFRIGDYQARARHHRQSVRARPARRPSPAARSCTGTSTTSRPPSRGCCRWAPPSTSRSPRAATGFVTAAVVDPFGNVLGVMYNPHYLEILARDPGTA